MLFIANFIELFYINNSERIRILNINFLFVQRTDSTYSWTVMQISYDNKVMHIYSLGTIYMKGMQVANTRGDLQELED